jgi:hypothetical protein
MSNMRNNRSTNNKRVSIFGAMLGTVAGIAGLVAVVASVILHRNAFKRLIEIREM